MQSTKDFMLALCSEYAGSSFESPADKLIINAFSPPVDEIRKGKIGSLIFRKKGKNGKKRIAVAAYMDEIGMMVYG